MFSKVLSLLVKWTKDFLSAIFIFLMSQTLLLALTVDFGLVKILGIADIFAPCSIIMKGLFFVLFCHALPIHQYFLSRIFTLQNL